MGAIAASGSIDGTLISSIFGEYGSITKPVLQYVICKILNRPLDEADQIFKICGGSYINKLILYETMSVMKAESNQLTELANINFVKNKSLEVENGAPVWGLLAQVYKNNNDPLNFDPTSYLNSYPENDGSYHFKSTNPQDALNGSAPGNWSVDRNRWEHPKIPGRGESELGFGNYNGLDYMYLYNLYRLYKINDNTLPLYSKEAICPKYSTKIPEVNTKEIIVGETVAGLTSSLTVNPYTFNYDEIDIRLEKYLVQSLIINGGELKVQEKLKVCNNSFGTTVVMVNSGGNFIMGNPSGTEPTITRITKGNKLLLGEQGIGNFTIHKNSRLIIEAGASLWLKNNNYVINLVDATSVLEIRGKIHLENSNLNIQGNGYVLFNYKNDGVDNLDDYCITSNITTSTVNFMRDPSVPRTKMIEVAAGTDLYPSPDIKLFKMVNIMAELKLYAGIKLNSRYHIVSNEIVGGMGISILNTFQHQWINNNSFTNCESGLHILRAKYAALGGYYKTYIDYNTFTNCRFAIKSHYASVHIGGNTFTNCEDAITTYEQKQEIKVEANKFDHINLQAGAFHSEVYASVAIAGNSIINSNKGFVFNGSNAVLTCNYFNNTNTPVNINREGFLNMSNNDKYTGWGTTSGQLGGGYNTLKFNKSGVTIGDITFFLSHSKYNIDYGHNSYYKLNPSAKSVNVWKQLGDGSRLNPIRNEINDSYWDPAPVNMIWPSNPDGIEGNNQTNGHFNINEKEVLTYPYYDHIYGAQLPSPANSCPVSSWNPALADGDNFSPFGVGGFHYSAHYNYPFSLDFPTNYGTGVLPGKITEFDNAINSVKPNSDPNHFPNDGSTWQVDYVSKPGLIVLGNTMLDNLDATYNDKSMRYMFDIAYRYFITSLAQVSQYEDSTETTLADNNEVVDKANELFNTIQSTDIIHQDDEGMNLYVNKFKTEKDRMVMYWNLGNLNMAQSTNNYLSGFAQSTEMPIVNLWQCRIQTDIDLRDNVISLLEYENRVINCSQVWREAMAQALENSAAGIENGAEEPAMAGIAFNIVPNPVTNAVNIQYTLTQSGSVQFYIIDKFGNTVTDETTPIMETGSYTHSIPFSGFAPDVYSLIVTFNNESRSKNFIKNED